MAPRLLRDLRDTRAVATQPEQVALLTTAERRVVSLLSSGITSNDDIARALSVSVNTVRTHAAAALRKLELDDRTQLALWGARNGV